MFSFRVGVPTLVCVLHYTLFSRKFNFKGFFAENKEPFSFARTEPIERESCSFGRIMVVQALNY